jgi:hypothetical protein
MTDKAPSKTPEELMRGYYAARRSRVRRDLPETGAADRPSRDRAVAAIEVRRRARARDRLRHGYWTQFIAPVAQHVTALDAAPETLAIAKARVAGTNVSFVVGDAYALPAAGTTTPRFADSGSRTFRGHGSASSSQRSTQRCVPAPGW